MDAGSSCTVPTEDRKRPAVRLDSTAMVTVVSSKKPKDGSNEKLLTTTADVSEREEQQNPRANGTGISRARQRWKLLSSCLKRHNHAIKPTTFVIFEATAIQENSGAGTWYHLKSPPNEGHAVEFDVHMYSTGTITLDDLAGFNNTGNVRLWPSEECLAFYLLRHDSLVRNKSVLELGAGMIGLSGLVSAVLGAADVLLTDGNAKSVENARRIVEVNSLGNRITCRTLTWNDLTPSDLHQFDVILCADCLFFTEQQRALLDCTHRYLKSGGVAYFMAPDRGGTARDFVQLVYDDRERWQNVSVDFHIEKKAEYQETLDAVHHSCMLIQDETIEELEKKGQKMEFDKEVVAQIAYTLCDTLCVTWPDELIQFAKHARRSIVNIADLKLLFRRNQSVLSLIDKIAENPLLSGKQKQPRRVRSKKRCESNDNEQMEGGGVNSSVPKDKNMLKLTNFWNQPSTSHELSQALSDAPTNDAEEQRNRNSELSQPIKTVTSRTTSLPGAVKAPVKSVSELRKTVSDRRKGQKQAAKRSQNLDVESCLETVGNVMRISSDLSNDNDSAQFNVSGRKECCKSGIVESENAAAEAEKVIVKEEMSSRNRTVIHLKDLDDDNDNGDALASCSSERRPVAAEKEKSDEIKVGFRNDEMHTNEMLTTFGHTSVAVIGKTDTENAVRPMKKRINAADKYFSAFKFESDDEEESEMTSSLPKTKGAVNEIGELSSEANHLERFTVGRVPQHIPKEQSQNPDAVEEGDEVDLDATIFDF